MFYFRIDRVRFLDNGGIKSGLGIFGHDFARVKFLSFITPSNQNVPQLDKWLRTNDPASKQTALEKLVRRTLSTRELTEVDRVQDNVPVSFGDTSRQMLIGGVQFHLRALGAGVAVAHVAVEYDGQLFVGDLIAGPVHPVLSGGSLDAWFKRLQELRSARPRRVFPARGEPGGMALIANQMIYIKQLMDFVAAENPRLPAPQEALARVKNRMLEAYPAYASPERLDALVAAEWQRQAGN